MEGAGGGGVAALALDCEDMFKEITKKLYGEEAAEGAALEFGGEPDEARPEEHLTAWGLAALMQHGVPPPGILQPNFTPRTDPTAEDRWTAAEEPLAWAHSRVAAYNPAQRLFKCAECECVGFLARVAEHWLGTHSHARAFQCPLPACGFASGWARAVRQHLARDHHSDPAAADHLLRDNPALDDLTRYLQRLKAKVESLRHERRPPPEPAAGPAPPAPAPALEGDGKRYVCGACPYSTDRRDLFTRHENIHRDEKPFHCYLCQKQFNRADHVKKHFLRMHRDQPYDLNRIRRLSPKASPPPPPAAPQPAPSLYYSKPSGEPPPPAALPPLLAAPPPAPPAPQVDYRAPPPLVKQERVQLKSEPPAPPAPPPKPAPPAPPAAAAPPAASRRKGERRYACGYCAWSGVDNWCLKRHLNTHLKPFACALCEYKAARAERLATHVHKVHNKQACGKCAFLADDQSQLAAHLRQEHHIESRNLKVPSASARAPPAAAAPPPAAAPPAYAPAPESGAAAGAAGARRREARAGGAARLFGYLEASDGSGDEYEAAAAAALAADYGAPPPAAAPPPPDHYARDKENAAPALHHAAPPLHHDHCLRY